MFRINNVLFKMALFALLIFPTSSYGQENEKPQDLKKMYADILGEWDATLTFTGQNTDVEFAFFIKDNKLMGSFDSAFGDSSVEDITYKDKELVMHLETHGMHDMKITVEAKFKDDELDGLFATEMGDIYFVATKRKGKKE